jgi:hypothetical protein
MAAIDESNNGCRLDHGIAPMDTNAVALVFLSKYS